jgi:hypothetical protein
VHQADGAEATTERLADRLADRLDRLIVGFLERLPRSRAIATAVVVLAAIAMAILLTSIVRTFTFLADEWRFVALRRDPSVESLLTPYNNHWQTIPILVYQVALELRGLASYGLLAAAGAAGHALAALALFAALRTVRPWLAAAAAIALLAFAWSDEVLLWPVNMSFTLPVAFGFAALVAWTVRRPRAATDAAGALAFLTALMSGGVAIAFGFVATAVILADGTDRRRLLWPGAAWVVYAAWFLAFGRTGDALGNAQAADLTLLPAFVAQGFAALAAPALGQDYRFRDAGLLLIALGLGLAAGRLGPRPHRGWIALAGIAVLYGLIGLARLSKFDTAGSEAPRYLYPAFALLLFGAATIVDRLYDSIASARGRRWLAVGVGVWLGVALVGDVGKLARSTTAYAERAATIRAELWLLEELRPAIESHSAAAVPIDPHLFTEMAPGHYYGIIDDIVDLPGPFKPPSAWPSPQRRAADELLGRLFATDLAFKPIAVAPDRVIDATDRRYGLHDMTTAAATDAATPGCTAFTVTGADPFVALRLLDGESIAVRTDGQRTLQVFPSVLTDSFGAIVRSVQPAPGAWYAVVPPALGAGWPWRLRVDAPPGSSNLDVCLVPAPGPAPTAVP